MDWFILIAQLISVIDMRGQEEVLVLFEMALFMWSSGRIISKFVLLGLIALTEEENVSSKTEEIFIKKYSRVIFIIDSTLKEKSACLIQLIFF